MKSAVHTATVCILAVFACTALPGNLCARQTGPGTVAENDTRETSFLQDERGDGTRERLERHVYTLTADSLLGRRAGSPEGRKAAGYVAGQFREIGLAPFTADSSYLQPFRHGFTEYNNVIGVLKGRDPDLRDEWIILGAHFDHLGYKVNLQGDTIIYRGADDNASGTAALIETARNLKAREDELGRSVMFIAFDAEETGLYGSSLVAKQMAPEKVKFMASMDMVGWLSAGKKLRIAGVAMLDGGRDILAAAQPERLELDLRNFDRMVFTGSDHDPFAERGIPAVYVTTGLKSPYHKPEDTPDRIDYEGMALVTDYMTGAAMSLSRHNQLEPSGKISYKHRPPATFEGGITAAIGSNRHVYRKGALDGKSGFAWHAGLYCQINMGAVAIRPKVVYEQRNAMWPVDIEERTAADFSTSGLYVPVDVMFMLPKRSPVYYYVFAGAYYSRTFTASIGDEKIWSHENFNRNEWGMQWGFGMNLYNLSMELTDRYAATGIFTQTDKIRNSSLYFTIGYRF